jgi:hypothetical protein
MNPEKSPRHQELDRIAIAIAKGDGSDPILASTKIEVERTSRSTPAQAEDTIRRHGTPIAITADGGHIYPYLRQDGRGQLDIVWASGIEKTIKFYFGKNEMTPKFGDQAKIDSLMKVIEKTGTVYRAADVPSKIEAKESPITKIKTEKPKEEGSWVVALLGFSMVTKHLSSIAIFIFLCWSLFFTGDYSLGIFGGFIAFILMIFFVGFVQMFPFGTTLTPLLFEWWWHDRPFLDFSTPAWVLSGISMAANIGFLISMSAGKKK